MHVSLHVKSDFSAGYGTATVDELVRCAARHGCPAIALTDVENMYGQVHFHLAARALGLRAITGVELRQRHGPRFVGDKLGRLVLLARDRAGYESLCRIVTARRREPAQPSGAPTDCLDTNPRGVFFLSDDVGVLDALLRAGVSEADVRFLLVRPGGAKAPGGVRAVADTDVVMAHPDDRALHALRLAIKQRRTIGTATESEPSERSFADAPALRALFADAPDAVTESLRVAEACELQLGEGPLIAPSIEQPSGHTADEILEAACRARLDDGRGNGRWDRAIYDIRLREELGAIQQLGLADYFLIVGEIADYAREHDIALVGRGSAVSSLVAHLLGVTAVDPIVHGLYFERLLHLGRRDPPDVDLDLPSDRRDEVIDWVFRRFGRDRVAMVSAHQRFQRHSAFREGLKAFGMRAVDVDRFCERLPTDDADAEAPLPLALLTDRYRMAVPLIERLIGTFQHLSVHPGGIVIATPRTDRHAPLERAPKGWSSPSTTHTRSRGSAWRRSTSSAIERSQPSRRPVGSLGSHRRSSMPTWPRSRRCERLAPSGASRSRRRPYGPRSASFRSTASRIWWPPSPLSVPVRRPAKPRPRTFGAPVGKSRRTRRIRDSRPWCARRRACCSTRNN